MVAVISLVGVVLVSLYGLILLSLTSGPDDYLTQEEIDDILSAQESECSN